MAKMTFAEGVEKIAKALRKAGHDVVLAEGAMVIDGVRVLVRKDWSSDLWTGVIIDVGHEKVQLTKGSRVPVDDVLEEVERVRVRIASALAMELAQDSTNVAIRDVPVRGVEISVGSPRDEDGVIRIPFSIGVNIPHDKVRPLLEAMRGVLGGEEAKEAKES
jgi:hypothetical protein